MQVNGVSSAGFTLVNREIQQSLAEANMAVAAQRQRSLDAAAKRADDAATIAEQQRNRQATAVQTQSVTSNRQVDVYL